MHFKAFGVILVYLEVDKITQDGHFLRVVIF
jgi:hypothetical protein